MIHSYGWVELSLERLICITHGHLAGYLTE